MTLPPLAATEFPAVFAAVHGVPPFPWQYRLVDRLAGGGGWPEALDLPTGTGKTAAIDAALFHLALQVGNQAGRQAASSSMPQRPAPMPSAMPCAMPLAMAP